MSSTSSHSMYYFFLFFHSDGITHFEIGPGCLGAIERSLYDNAMPCPCSVSSTSQKYGYCTCIRSKYRKTGRSLCSSPQHGTHQASMCCMSPLVFLFIPLHTYDRVPMKCPSPISTRHPPSHNQHTTASPHSI